MIICLILLCLVSVMITVSGCHVAGDYDEWEENH